MLLLPGPPYGGLLVPWSEVSPAGSVLVPVELEVVVPKEEQLDAQSLVHVYEHPLVQESLHVIRHPEVHPEVHPLEHLILFAISLADCQNTFIALAVISEFSAYGESSGLDVYGIFWLL